MKTFDEIQKALEYNDLQMAELLGVTRGAYSQLKRAQGNQHNKFFQQLEGCRKALKMSHKAFYEWVGELTS